MIGWASNVAKQHENEQKHQDQSEAAAWIIAPARTIGPPRQSPDQQEYKYDDEYGSHCLLP